jgi:Domain of unknown function (DUF4382)
MTVHRPRFAGLAVTSAIALLATACGAAKTSTGAAPTGFGQLAVKLTDAPPDKLHGATQIFVTIDEVTVHSTAGGWAPIFQADATTPPLRVDLLKLTDSAIDLGFLDLPKGTTVTQIRLHVDPAPAEPNEVFVSGSTDPIPLVVPSGIESGIKIHGPWQIAECQATAVTLDFDGENSIFTHPAKQGSEYILRPVIRVKLAETLDVGCTDAATPPASQDCTSDAECATNEGAKCLGAVGAMICAGPPGTPCTVGGECISGTCDAILNRCAYSGAGEPCYADGQCLDHTCDLATNTCSRGQTNDPCSDATDCSNAECSASAVCPPPDGSLGAGAYCTPSDVCLSGNCSSEGTCETSGQGGWCHVDADCDAGLTCVMGSDGKLGQCRAE